ncbi:hypothetical protein J5N97_010843 [Dioscorea zingiberensis]|uniref:Uncharacterized protein n=1 Tax=Dioscorea zingiberensis TaxID=325984 RepID=A0A9D5D062_9LILI|nr:hypothetical protein J5N97_010843 [Dioscorea zingiberensis]
MASRSLVFAINGERFELSEVDPSTTLLEFLRTETRFKGAKLSCGEGGCGACVVLLSTYDPKCGQVKDFSVSSCLTLLCSIHLCSVTTIEGLGNSRDGFHSIQNRFAGFHASQCGFCTPGMCMSLFSALVNADKTKRPDPPNGFSKLTLAEAEKAVAGNLCRCTGYRPIVDACKSFAADVDLEDLGLNSFWKKGDKDLNVEKLPLYSRGHSELCMFPDFLKSEVQSSLQCYSGSLSENGSKSTISLVDASTPIENVSLAKGCWYRPSSLDELNKLMVSEIVNGPSSAKMVAGNTGSGFYKEVDLFDRYVDIRGIPELSVVKRNSRDIEIGAAVTISRVIEVLKEESEGLLSNERLMLNKIAGHMNKVASQFVRNTASLGGNLIMAQRSQFPSDIATILLAVGSTVCIYLTSQRITLSLEEFLQRPPCEKTTLLLSIHIPFWSSFQNSDSGMNDYTNFNSNRKCNLLFETYRASPRPFGNALPYANSAFLAHTSLNEVSGYYHMENARLAFGAFGCEHPFRASKVEKFLIGKTLTASVLLEAIKLLRETIILKDGTSHSAYRLSLAVGFLFKFLHPLVKDLIDPLRMVHTDMVNTALSSGDPNGTLCNFSGSGSLDKTLNIQDVDHFDHHGLLFRSKQVMGFNEDYSPVGKPIKKAGAEVQASGEAVFVDDLPSPKDCLYGSFIYSTQPMAEIKGIEFKTTLASQKIFAVISHKDIPRGGKNIGSTTMFGDEPLLANDIAEYAGQPLGIVIAEKQRFANMVAKQAIVSYSTENSEPPILSIEDALRRSSFFEVPPFLYPKQVGDFSKGMEEAEHKILSAEVCLGSQYYFYMETQTAIAIPDEDNCMLVYSSTQCPEVAQQVIAKCLGIPFHNVRVITRRVGGGFGGKATRSLRVAAACALAAYKLRRPIRMYLDRKTDMILAGGRHPMKVTYSVGFKSSGKITALHVDLLINAGISPDVSPILPHNIIGSLKKYNWGALSFTAKLCKTNISSKSAMRGPGEVQGSFIAEAIIEHVASNLSVDANLVRKMNLHNPKSLKMFYEGSSGEGYEYTLPSIFDKFTAYAGYHGRVEMIQQFNSCNKWRKRGLSCVPIVQQVILRPTPGKVGVLNDGSIIVEVGGIELGQGLWTKVKQMAAFALGQLWDDGSQDLLERVRVIQADTFSLIQGGWTAGSTTSESSCEAVRLACNILVDRLKFLKDSLQEKAGSVSWDTLIFQANTQAVNLSASTYWVPDFGSQSYLNYGAALTEVEVDLLTGATTILQTDLIYDCGKSLNPAVDLGQIEGAFVQGIGFFMYEEYLANSEGLIMADGTWTYKIPSVDTIPKQFNVQLLNSGHHEKRVLSSKASGEPPLLLAASVHCATRHAIKAAREEYHSGIPNTSPDAFHLDVPATMPVVKELCGFDIVESQKRTFYLSYHSIVGSSRFEGSSCGSMARDGRNLVFAVNGERFELDDFDPSTTLLEFLRTETRFKGAKLGCGEGGCGACVVLLSTYDPECGKVKEFSVSSCLTLLCSINLCSVTTTEGLGNSKDGFHSIQERFAGFHASQCGFCTPGMCMSLFSALVNADKTNRPEPPNGFSKITSAEAEKAISGNLCRCTGYRPIVDACKSFAADVDLEDLGLNSFWKKGDRDLNVNKLPFYSRSQSRLGRFPDFLKSEIESLQQGYFGSLSENGSNSAIENVSLAQGRWYRPSSIDELNKLMVSEGLHGTSNIKLVAGNTGSGFYKEIDLFDKYVDIRGIPELSVVKRNSRGIEIGAAVTISRVIEVLKEESEGLLSNERLMFSKIADHMNRVASQFVRNTASLGGNLIMAQRSQFPSDIATILLAADSTVCIHVTSQVLTLSLEEFLGSPSCDSSTLLLSVHIPFWSPFSNSFSGANDSTSFKSTKESGLLFETFRVSPRPLGNALAYVNSTFIAQTSLNEVSGDHFLDNVRLAFGAFGCEHAIRAKEVEKFLVGKAVTVSVLLEAIKLLRETITMKDGTPQSAYRSSLAVSFLFRFLQPIAKGLTEPLSNVPVGLCDTAEIAEDPNRIPKKCSNLKNWDCFQIDHHDLLLSSEQLIGSNGDYHPVGEPIKKAGAHLQASGEAVFVDDLPTPKDCLYGAFIYSTHGLAHLKGIEFKSTLTSQKIITVVSSKDIPSGGKNNVVNPVMGGEPVLANYLTEYAGQPLGIVIAEKQRFANMAAKQAIVNYSTENLEPPILSIEDAVRRSSFFEIPPYYYPSQVGDFPKGMEEADHKILSAEVRFDSQYHFYMETQTVMAIPEEDNCMLVYSSTQIPEATQRTVAECLGIPYHNVRVITRRVGGGFGGKASKSVHVAAACALAAYKLRRPIRMYLDRKTDMIMASGRHPMKVNYSIGFKSSGKITALHVDLFINAGISEDLSQLMPLNIIAALKKYNWGALSFNLKICKTNTSSKSAMRAPGEVQGSFIAEAVIEHVASILSIRADSIRKMNLHDFESLTKFYGDSAGEAFEYTLSSIFEKLTSHESYHYRDQIIQQFNSCNRWTKHGLSCIPVIYEVRVRPTPGKVGILNDGSVIVEVGGIEIGQGLWTKVKQMAAFALGQLWNDGSQDLLERVRVIQADTFSLIQGGWTAGSTTSESSCEAVRLACNILVDRLKFLKESLQEKMGSISWDTLIAQANTQAVNLSASVYWVPDSSSDLYLNYGAAISEVEVDLLTGATTILRSDLTYDCGKSLNPAVDLGQIEGAFVQGIGFFMYEEFLTNSEGLVVTDGTWTYKIPTVDTIPKQFNVELLDSGHHQKRVLSSKASGEPPLLLAASVHCAIREAIKAAREEFHCSTPSTSPSPFQLDVPATMPVIKELCGLDIVEKYLENILSAQQLKTA